MSTHESTVRNRKWVTPVTALVIGLGYLVAGVLGDNLEFGVFGLLLMVVTGGAFWLIGTRSETVAGLLDRRDERINAIDASATQFAGMTTLVVVLGAFMVEIARGQDGMPYAALGAIAGVAYVVALVWGRLRR
jgi:hypothetical protein